MLEGNTRIWYFESIRARRGLVMKLTVRCGHREECREVSGNRVSSENLVVLSSACWRVLDRKVLFEIC